MHLLRAEDELEKVLLSIAADLPPEKLLAGLSLEDRMQGLSAEQRMRGLSPEERLCGLTPEELERVRQMFEQPPQVQADPSSKP